MSTPTTFTELGVPAPLAKSLKAMRFEEPFEIQSLTIPDAMAGRDILGRAPTGSGKTLSFGLPLLARLEKGRRNRPTGLVLCPTRELAEQIRRELEPLAESVGRSILSVYGGKGFEQQLTGLARGVDLLVACPGRLLDLIDQGAVDLGDVDVVVVDEADRMADMGFLPDVRKLLDRTSSDRQTMLYSATLDHDVQVLIDTYQNDPAEHAVAELEPDLSVLTHRFIEIPKKDRIWLAADLITDTGSTIVFVRTRHGVDRLARQLQQHGVKTGYIHGGRTQSQRDRALQLFISGKVQALVATDVAARGIHVDNVACVIHYDPPAEDKDYVHRSGRTARAGATGVVVSLLDPPQLKAARKMQKKLGIEAKVESTPDRTHFLEAIPTRDRPAARRSARKGKPAAKSSSRRAGKPQAKGSTRTSTKSSARQVRKPVGKKARPASRKAGSQTNRETTEVSVGEQRRKPKKSNSSARSGGKAKAKPGKHTNAAAKSGKHTNAAAKPGKHTKAAAKPGKRSKTQAAGRPTSKRSGKPRPKNRKGKPNAGRRR